jgi:hypothetical protein
MRYVAGLMVMAFVLGGVGLFAAGARELIRRFVARHRLRPAKGEIVRIEKRQETTDSDSGRTTVYDFPEIKFRPERGSEQTFISDIGTGERTARYAVGERIEVLYDPVGELSPMINSWAGLWVSPLIQIIVGPMFVFAGLFVSWAFGDKILGQ